MAMQRLSEQAFRRPGGSSPEGESAAKARAEGPWTASGRGVLAIILMVAGAVLALSGRSARSDRGPLDREIPSLVLDLNEAPAGVLSALPGVGRGLARRIVAERRARPFASPADLRRRTPGVGPATLARLAPHLRDKADRLARAE